MAITYVGAASAASSSVSLPTFEVGDVAFVIAYGASSPTVPSGWMPFRKFATAAGGWRILQAGDTTTGTWTNATRLLVAVYRGAHLVYPVDVNAADGVTPFGGATQSAKSADAAAMASSRRVHMVVLDQNTSTYTGTGWTNRTGTGLAYGVADAATMANSTWTFPSASGADFLFGIREPSDFPIIADQDTTSGTVTSNSSSWTLTYPTNIAAGDLLLLLMATDGSTLQSASDPFAVRVINGGANGLKCGRRVADGSETGTFSIAMNNEQGSWVVYRIPAGTWDSEALDSATTWSVDSTVGPAITQGTINTNANPDPDSLNPPGWASGNTLWIAAMSADTSRTVSAYPSSPDTFTNTGSLVSGGTGGATLAWGRLEKDATSVDPGTFTISSSDDWVAATIAILGKSTKTGSFTAAAEIKAAGGSGSFTADAVIKASSGTKTFSANAVIKASSGTKTFSANAIILKTQSEYVLISQDTGTSSVAVAGDGGVAERQAQSIQIGPCVVGSATLALSRVSSPSDSVTLSLVSELDGSPLGTSSLLASTITTNPFPGSTAGFALNSVIPSNATYYLELTRTGSRDTVNYVRWSYSSADPYAGGSEWSRASGAWTESATQDFRFILYGQLAFTANAEITSGAQTQTGSFTASAVIAKTASTSFSVNAIALRSSGTLTFTADAILLKPTPLSTTADATIFATISGSFTADADIFRTTSGSFTANAVAFRAIAGSASADAVIFRAIAGTFTADADIFRTMSSSATADAIVFRAQAGSFAGDSVITKTVAGSATGDADVKATQSGATAADAIRLRTFYFGSGPDPR